MAAFRRVGRIGLVVLGLFAAAAALGCPAFGYGGEPHHPSIAVSASVVTPGGSLSVVGTDFTPRASAQLSLHSAVVSLGTVQIDTNGQFSTRVTVPADEPTGTHTLVALDVATGDQASVTITVAAIPIDLPPPGGIAGTGVAVAGLLALGIVLLVAGKVLAHAGRRRDVRS